MRPTPSRSEGRLEYISSAKLFTRKSLSIVLQSGSESNRPCQVLNGLSWSATSVDGKTTYPLPEFETGAPATGGEFIFMPPCLFCMEKH